jgi:hypothetical protein
MSRETFTVPVHSPPILIPRVADRDEDEDGARYACVIRLT